MPRPMRVSTPIVIGRERKRSAIAVVATSARTGNCSGNGKEEGYNGIMGLGSWVSWESGSRRYSGLALTLEEASC